MHVWWTLVYFTLVSPYLIFVCLASSFRERENFHQVVEYDQGPNVEQGGEVGRQMAPLPLLNLFRQKRALNAITKLATGKILFPLGGRRLVQAPSDSQNGYRSQKKSQRRNGGGGGGGGDGGSGSILNNLCQREGKRRSQMGATGTTSIVSEDYGASNAYAQDAGRNSASSASAQALQHGNTGLSYAATGNKDYHARPGLVNTLLCAVQIETILQPVAGAKKNKKKRRRNKKKRRTTTTTTTTPAPAPSEYDEDESEGESSEESRRRRKRFVQLPFTDEDLQVAQYIRSVQRSMRNSERDQLELKSESF